MSSDRRSLGRQVWQLGSGACLCILIGVAPFFTGCDQSEPEKLVAPPPLVTAAKPIFGEVEDYLEFIGRISSFEQVELRARVGGFLEEMHFQAGDFVQEGDKIYTIDKRSFEAAVNRARAEVQSAEAGEKLASASFDRNKQLFDQGVVSQQEFDVVVAELAVAEAATLAARANLESAELNLAFTEIVAPISGRISNSLIDRGNLVQADITPLARIVARRPVYVFFDLDEALLIRLMRRRAAVESIEEIDLKTIRERNIPVWLAIGDGTDFEFEGTVDYIDPELNPTTGTIRVRAVFPNDDQTLVPGMFARTRLTLSEPRSAVQVPLRAIGTDQDRRFVYIIDEAGVAQYRQVVVGRQTLSTAVIEEGLGPDDLVVIDGILRLRPGITPEVKPADLSQFTNSNAPAAEEPATP